MELIAIEGAFCKAGAPNIPASFYKVHTGPSPHVRIIGAEQTVIGGQPMSLDAAVLDELRALSGFVFNLHSVRIFNPDGVNPRPNS